MSERKQYERFTSCPTGKSLQAYNDLLVAAGSRILKLESDNKLLDKQIEKLNDLVDELEEAVTYWRDQTLEFL